MAKVKFVIPEEFLGSNLFTKTGQWLHEEKLVDFSFSFNKNVNAIPLDLHYSYYVAGDGVVFSALEEEKLDRVLETIKLYLKKLIFSDLWQTLLLWRLFPVWYVLL